MSWLVGEDSGLFSRLIWDLLNVSDMVVLYCLQPHCGYVFIDNATLVYTPVSCCSQHSWDVGHCLLVNAVDSCLHLSGCVGCVLLLDVTYRPNITAGEMLINQMTESLRCNAV